MLKIQNGNDNLIGTLPKFCEDFLEELHEFPY